MRAEESTSERREAAVGPRLLARGIAPLPLLPPDRMGNELYRSMIGQEDVNSAKMKRCRKKETARLFIPICIREAS